MSSLATSASISEPDPEPRAEGPDPRLGLRRVLVIDADLLIAEAMASALVRLTFAARFAMPINPAHLRDLATWRPGLALLNVDTVEPKVSVSAVSMLAADNVPVAILSSRPDIAVVGDCLAAGASTVVDKGCALVELVQVITGLLDGRVDGRVVGRVVGRERLTPFDVLTQREKCVLAELMDGDTPEVIARRGAASVPMVRLQIKSVLQKLGVNSQLAAVSLARRAGWTLDGTPSTGRWDGSAPPPPGTPGTLGQSA